MEPLYKGPIGTSKFVHCTYREVVHSSEVKMYKYNRKPIFGVLVISYLLIFSRKYGDLESVPST